MKNPNLPFDNPWVFDQHIMRVANHMTRTGIRVDIGARNKLSKEVEEACEEAQEKLNTVAGCELNVMSNPQMKKILYGELGLPKRTKPRKGGKRTITADEDAIRATMSYCQGQINRLKTPAKQQKYKIGIAICRLSLTVRKYRKQLSSYINIDLDPDNRARSTIYTAGTETWRFAHGKSPWDTGLNLGTVPRALRIMYIPDEGCIMIEADLNRGESWIYSHIAEDPEMMRIHQEMGDFHSETAGVISTAFGARPMTVEEIIRLNDEDDEEAYYVRYMGKRVNHASAYRMGPFKGADVINEEADETGIIVTPGQFKQAQKLWLNKYMGIPLWWDWIERELNRTRQLTSPYGRTRTFHGQWGDKLFRDATAHVPQNTSVDYMNLGMLDLYNFTQSKENIYDLKLLHQNHDSVLAQCRIEAKDEVLPLIQKILTKRLIITSINGREFDISIPIEVKYGHNWREMNLHAETT